MSVIDEAKAVLGSVGDLRDLINRLEALDEERAIVEDQLRSQLARIKVSVVSVPETVVNGVPQTTAPIPTRGPGITERVLSYVTGAMEPIGAMDIAKLMGASDQSTLDSIRAALSRLAAAKKIRKVAFGRYGPPVSATSTTTTTGGDAAA